MRAAESAGVPCVLNPAPVIPVVAELLGTGPLLTPNRSECLQLAALICGPTAPADVPTAARLVCDRTGAPVVVTLGGEGALVVTPAGEPVHVPPLQATVRDTTGAGDTFNGVLAARLAAGDRLETAVRTAVVAASLSVTRTGARGGMPTAAAISSATTQV